jgi:hypothetical protein
MKVVVCRESNNVAGMFSGVPNTSPCGPLARRVDRGTSA